ncbi:hypothetical protein ACVWZV_007035 [Bradyrhizobium sp. GM5.1]
MSAVIFLANQPVEQNSSTKYEAGSWRYFPANRASDTHFIEVSGATIALSFKLRKVSVLGCI